MQTDWHAPETRRCFWAPITRRALSSDRRMRHSPAQKCTRVELIRRPQLMHARPSAATSWSAGYLFTGLLLPPAIPTPKPSPPVLACSCGWHSIEVGAATAAPADRAACVRPHESSPFVPADEWLEPAFERPVGLDGWLWLGLPP